MAVRGIENVQRNMKAALEEISGARTHRAVYAILSQGQARAATMTPIDTSNLMNSMFGPQIFRAQSKMTGRVGYTAAYAAAVHDAPGKLKGLPRPKNRGNYWDPSAEPGFLELGFKQIKTDAPRILEGIYRV